MNEEETARKFHEVYERLAPNFGYETRTETREFESTTPNGKLMIVVMAEMLPLIKSSTIAKIREGLPKEVEADKFIWQVLYDIEGKRMTRFKGRKKIIKYYSDLMEKNINDAEGE